MSLVIAHLCGLLVLQSWTIWNLRRDRLLSISAVFITAWANLVVTAFLLSCVSKLGSHAAYVGISLALAFVFGWFTRSSFSLSPCPVVAHASEESDRNARILRICLWLCIAAVVVPTAALCLSYDPDNYDSIAYRLPRAFLFLSQGSLRQIGHADFRMQFYPFNLALAYMVSSIGGLAGPTLNMFGFVSWLVGGVTVARTASEFGAGRNASLFAAAAYLSAPAVLVSASSTNDDMIAGVPLLIGLLFFARWWRSCNVMDVVLAATGCGLSAGSKLHLPFYVPIALLFTVAVAFRWLIHRGSLPTLQRRMVHLLGAAAIIALLGLPALAVNRIETGRATPDLPNYQNKPFSLVAAATTTAVSSASLFLAPLPDLDLDGNQDRRKALYTSFNDWLNANFFRWVSPRLDYSNEPYYRFEGVASNDAYQGVWEQSAWLGFAPWLLLAIPILAWSQRKKQPRSSAEDRFRLAALWLAAGLFGWHLARCFALKYVGAAGIYYAYPMALAAPALSWLWSSVSGRGGVIARAACLGLLATNLILASNAFLYNQQRNIPEILSARHFRVSRDAVGPDLAAHLSASKNTLLAYTQWEMPLLDLIAVQPDAHYTMTHELTAAPAAGYDLSLMLNHTNVDDGEVPIQFQNDDRHRLNYLGMMRWGDQRAFGHDVRGMFDPSALESASGRSLEEGVVFDYRAEKSGLAGVLATGWAPPDWTYRWSNGPESRITVYLPSESSGCVLKGTAISAGRQTVKVSLNGTSLGSFDVNDWKVPGKSFLIPLPDGLIKQGGINNIAFGYSHLKSIGDVDVALGLVRAVLHCDKLKRSPSEVVSPLKPDGFAVLQFAEKRAGNGMLTGIKFSSLNGVDPDERFSVTVDPVRDHPMPAEDKASPPHVLQWGEWIDVPGGLQEGYLRVVLTRADRPQISARVYLPVQPGSLVELDPRTLPSGQVPN